MKRTIIVVIVCILSVSVSMAKDFQVNIKLGKHRTDNPYGVWTLEKMRANTKQFRAKLMSKAQCGIYPCLEYAGEKGVMSDIKVIDVKRFKDTFVEHKYYHFYWRKKKNQGYSDPNGEKINATISPIPQVVIHLKNSTSVPLTLETIESRSIYQQGGMADSTEYRVEPQVRKGAMEIAHNHSDKMTFPKGYILSVGKSIDLPLSLWVKNAAHGDGTGDLAYALELHYVKQGKKQTTHLVNLLQGDGEGYDMTAGGIVPAN